MAGLSERIKNQKPPPIEEAQKEATAIHSMAEDVAAGRKSFSSPVSTDIQSMSKYLDRVRQVDPTRAERIVEEENERQELKDEAGPLLYEQWEHILQEASERALLEFRQERSREIPAVASKQSQDGIVTDLEAGVYLNDEVIFQMRADKLLNRVFKENGKEDVLIKLIEFLKKQARPTEKDIRKLAS